MLTLSNYPQPFWPCIICYGHSALCPPITLYHTHLLYFHLLLAILSLPIYQPHLSRSHHIIFPFLHQYAQLFSIHASFALLLPLWSHPTSLCFTSLALLTLPPTLHSVHNFLSLYHFSCLPYFVPLLCRAFRFKTLMRV